MLSILIVDDEVITRKGLKSHVNWKKLGIDTIYDSGNAVEALKIVRECKPDLILSDVNMPGMNGIEMCREIRKIHKDCQIVFLSGYSDKEYLKGAIQLEAVNYVEKPIDIEEVEETLERAAQKQKTIKQGREQLKQLETENNSMIKKRLTERISVKNASLEYLKQDFEKLGMDWNDMEEFMAVTFHFFVEDRGKMEQFASEIGQIFDGVSYIHSTAMHYEIVVICAFPTRDSRKYRELLLHLQQEMYGRAVCYCAVGECVYSIGEVYKSCQTSSAKMQQLLFWKQDRLGFAKEKPEEKIDFDERIFDDFVNALKQYKEEDAKMVLGQLYSFMQNQQRVSVSSIKGIYFRFIEAIFQKADFSVDNSKAKDAAMIGMVWEKLQELESLELCQNYLLEETGEYFKNVDDLAEQNKTILMVIAYIQSNYKDLSLCLENIAKSVYLSPNYLSGLFRKKTGRTISRYITDVRVEHAKELLRDRSLKLYDIAVMCGYDNANYFTKIFKKATGITPSEYREKFDI